MELCELIKSDYIRYTGGHNHTLLNILLYLLFDRNHCFKYNFWLRLSSQKNLFQPLGIIMHRHMSRKYGIQISRKCKIGYGFYIGHGIGIVINPLTVIGNNVNISQFLSIGSNYGSPATIEDNVYIGPNVCIVENVHIGRGATIGAGSVVIKDVPDNTTVAGNPARIISEKPQPFIKNPYTPK